MKRHVILSGLAALFLLAGYSAGDTLQHEKPGLAPCLKESQHQLVIEWGTMENFEQMQGAGYRLTAERELFAVRHRLNTEHWERPALTVVSSDVYVDVPREVNATFLKVQALHSPGERGRFISYSNPLTGVYLRAVWNPELKTFQSRDMRALFDRLMELVPSDAAAGHD